LYHCTIFAAGHYIPLATNLQLDRAPVVGYAGGWQIVVGHWRLRGQGSPSAKLGTVAVVINKMAASTSRSFFTVFLLLKRN
jgi:hypothetical protein